MDDRERRRASDPRTPFSWGWRWLPSDLSPRRARVYRGATLCFLAVFVATLWPVHAWVSRVRPFVLGMPFSLFYLAALLVVAFAVLVGLFLWEGRQGDGAEGSE